MYGSAFDALARGVAAGRTRRGVIKGLGAAALGALGLAGAAPVGADACKADGKACKKDDQCCSGSCVGGTGSGSTAHSDGVCSGCTLCADGCCLAGAFCQDNQCCDAAGCVGPVQCSAIC
jgi:hypothetical protein